MPCRRAIELALVRVKERAAKDDFDSPGAAASELRRYVGGLKACRKRVATARRRSQKTYGKRGTKYQPK
jgi:hypothetical protein